MIDVNRVTADPYFNGSGVIVVEMWRSEYPQLIFFISPLKMQFKLSKALRVK